MDGKGRCLDNVFVERLWRSGEVRGHLPVGATRTVPELQRGLGRYFPFYNEERLHQSLDYRTPAAVYQQQRGGGEVGRVKERHSFSPRSPSAPVKGLRGEKECPGSRAEGADDVGERSSPGL